MSDLLVDRDGDLLVLTLNRPEKMNAISDDIRMGLLRELNTEMVSMSARAVLITGNGRGFCSGADLDPDTILARGPSIERQLQTGMNQVVRLMRDLPIPIVAAVNGAAAGAGFALALACDIIVASPSTKFYLTFAKIAAVLDAGSSAALTHKIGTARTTALAMLGGNVDAQTAKEWGLVHEVFEDDTLMEEAVAMAKRLAAGPTVSLGLIKREILAAQTSPFEDILHLEAASQSRAFATEDFEEGVRAFAESRKPQFKGY